MKEIKNVTTYTYDMGDGWMVDIVTMPTEKEAYLYHNGYGVKEFMFGMPNEQTSYDEFLEIVAANFDDYRIMYMEDHMQD